jgi:hypothetical protein
MGEKKKFKLSMYYITQLRIETLGLKTKNYPKTLPHFSSDSLDIQNYPNQNKRAACDKESPMGFF